MNKIKQLLVIVLLAAPVFVLQAQGTRYHLHLPQRGLSQQLVNYLVRMIPRNLLIRALMDTSDTSARTSRMPALQRGAFQRKQHANHPVHPQPKVSAWKRGTLITIENQTGVPIYTSSRNRKLFLAPGERFVKQTNGLNSYWSEYNEDIEVDGKHYALQASGNYPAYLGNREYDVDLSASIYLAELDPSSHLRTIILNPITRSYADKNQELRALFAQVGSTAEVGFRLTFVLKGKDLSQSAIHIESNVWDSSK